MNKKNFVGSVLSVSFILAMAAGCASMGGGKSAEQLAVTGPSVVTAKSEPSTIELNTNLQPTQQARIFADVKDFQAPVKDVRVRFLHVPIELKMNNVAGTTWQTQLSANQLKRLAVSGQTMRYQAEVVATDSQGRTATSKSPIDISIKAPEPTQISS